MLVNDTKSAASTQLAYVLDDEVEIGTLVCHCLVACGYETRQFVSPAPFLTAVKTSPPELIVLDLALGQSDAVEVIHQIKSLNYAGKVLLISGRDEATLREIAQIGARHGLLMLPPLKKPFRVAEFEHQLSLPANAAQPQATTMEAATTDTAAVELAEALRNRWLELWYQPKINLKSLSVCGLEALLRVRHPEHGIIVPSDSLPAADDPLYHPLSNFVLGRAILDWDRFAKESITIQISLNMPLSALLIPDFINIVRGWLPSRPKFPGMIFEITEDEIMCDLDSVREVISRLELYNCRISIDDFGLGYSSLSRLRDLRFCELKLNRSFVSNCAFDQAKQSLCRTTIELAHGFGASVCAEGVENDADLQTLIKMRCDIAQGDLFGKPMPYEECANTLRPSTRSSGRSNAAARLARAAWAS